MVCECDHEKDDDDDDNCAITVFNICIPDSSISSKNNKRHIVWADECSFSHVHDTILHLLLLLLSLLFYEKHRSAYFIIACPSSKAKRNLEEGEEKDEKGNAWKLDKFTNYGFCVFATIFARTTEYNLLFSHFTQDVYRCRWNIWERF